MDGFLYLVDNFFHAVQAFEMKWKTYYYLNQAQTSLLNINTVMSRYSPALRVARVSPIPNTLSQSN